MSIKKVPMKLTLVSARITIVPLSVGPIAASVTAVIDAGLKASGSSATGDEGSAHI